MDSGGLSRPPNTRSLGRSNLPVRRSPSIRPSADGAGALTARRRIAPALLRSSIAAALLAIVAILD